MKKLFALLLAMVMMLGCVAFAEAVNPDEIADTVTAHIIKATRIDLINMPRQKVLMLFI